MMRKDQSVIHTIFSLTYRKSANLFNSSTVYCMDKNKKMNNVLIKKGLLIVILGVAMTSITYAQKKKASPMKYVEQIVSNNKINIQYSSPSVKGRKIWGELVPYNEVWRTGANEATTFEVSKDCKVGGKKLPKGKYSLFTIPSTDEWTVIINSDANQWGAYKYKESKDVLRFKVKPESNSKTESFNIDVSKTGLITLAWDELKVSFEIK